MSCDPKISVLLPVYNAEQYLKEAVDSILAQTYTDFEVIAIDDGSQDNSLAILNSYTDSRIRVFHQDNCGLPATLNKAASLCRAKYIARMDADDICKPYRFQMQYNYLEANPECSLVSGAMEYISEKGVVWGRTYPITRSKKIKKKILEGVNLIVHPAVMMRKEVFFCCGGYCESLILIEDIHLWAKMLRKGYVLKILPKVMIAYRIHGNALSMYDVNKSLRKDILNYDDPPKMLLDLFGNNTTLKSEGLRPIEIQNKLNCKFSKLIKYMQLENVVEKVCCGVRNLIS